MAQITANTGLITGTDISGTVDKLMELASVPRLRVQAQVESLKSQQVVLSEMTALIVGVQLQATRLGTLNNLSSLNVTSSDTSVIKATSTGTPVPGSFDVRTVQTAQASSQTSTVFESAETKLTAGELKIRTGGFVDSTARLDHLRGGAGVERGRIEITNREGNSRIVDLRFAATLQDVADTINRTDGLRINATIENDRLVLSDLTGSTSANLKIDEVDGGRTAADLGFSGTNTANSKVTGENLAFLSNSTALSSLRDGRGLDFTSGNDLSFQVADGRTVDIDISDTDVPTTIGKLISEINNSTDLIEASIADDGVSLKIVDKTTGVADFTATGRLAESLGLTNKIGVSGTLNGARIQSPATSVLLSSLKGGQGIGALGSISVTNRNGTTTSIDLSAAETLDDVIDTINNAGAGVTASYNKEKTGISIQDVSGSTSQNLVIDDGDANNAATKLKIKADADSGTVNSGALGLQYITRNTKLSELNRGAGITNGTFKITNSAGQSASITMPSDSVKTVGDVIDKIKSLNIGVTARLNSDGDGFVLVDNAGGEGNLVIADQNGAETAADLGIAGTHGEKLIDGVPSKGINSSQTFTLTVEDGDTVNTLITKLKADSNSPINASLLNVGGGGVRLIMTAKQTGFNSRVYVEGDSVGITTAQTTAGRDAIIAVGSSSSTAGTMVYSSKNQFSDVVTGISLSVEGTSDSNVTVTVEETFSKIESNLKLFIDQYNKVVDKLTTETKYDSTTQSTGYLFGTTEALRIERGLSRFVTGRTISAGKIQSLAQLGVDVDEEGKLSLNSSKLNNAITEDSDAVIKFLSDEKVGLAARGKSIFENLVGVDNGALITRNQSLQAQVDSKNERLIFLDLKLSRERLKLTKQFVGMETAIAKLQSNFSGLDLSIYDGLFSSNS